MKIINQIKLLTTIQANYQKEAARLIEKGDSTPAYEIEWQIHNLDHVINTLQCLDNLRTGFDTIWKNTK